MQNRNDEIKTKSVSDFWSIVGSMKTNKNNGKSVDEIMELESQAWEKMAVKRYKKYLRENQ